MLEILWPNNGNYRNYYVYFTTMWSLGSCPMGSVLLGHRGCWNKIVLLVIILSWSFSCVTKNFKKSLTNPISLIAEFGDYSGVRIIWNKSVLRPIDPLSPTSRVSDPPLMVVGQFKYLGIIISPNRNLVISLNIVPLITKLVFSVMAFYNVPNSCRRSLAYPPGCFISFTTSTRMELSISNYWSCRC